MSKIGQRGKKAEAEVKKLLDRLKERNATFDYVKLRDARSSGGKGAVKQIADFQIFMPGHHVALEVKEVNHTHLLPNKNVTQLPKMGRRELAGGDGLFIIYFTKADVWRWADYGWMNARKHKPSYDFKGEWFHRTLAACWENCTEQFFTK